MPATAACKTLDCTQRRSPCFSSVSGRDLVRRGRRRDGLNPVIRRQSRRCRGCHAQLESVQLVADIADASTAVPIGLGVLTAFLLAYGGLRVLSSSQLTFVTAAMLSRNLPKEQLRIVQVGGTVKELYYYPSSTVQVTMVGKDVNESLMESASMQAGVPVVCRRHGLDELSTLGSAVADAVVVLGGLQTVHNLQAFFSAVLKVLKPGGRFIFIHSVSADSKSGVQSLLGAEPLEMSKLEALKRARDFETVQWDFANEALDPHVVGLAVKKTAQR